jgi:adenylate cyclase
MSFIEELKRRNVVRVGIAYVLMSWVLLQGADFVLDLAGAPEWVIRALTVAVLVGLPIALLFAWAFELTPQGIKRERDVDRSESITPRTGQTLDRLIIAFLLLAVVVLLADRFWPTPGSAPGVAAESSLAPEPSAGAATVLPTSAAARSVAVLPFLALTRGPDDGYFADGLTEEILNALAQLPELLVTARTSAFQFKGQDIPVQEIATQLGVEHVVEGSVRRSGERLRVTAQLIRAADGFHLWSQNYDAESTDTISVQEDIAEKIALALDVVLDEQKRAAMQRAGLRDAEAFIAFQRALELYEEAHINPGRTSVQLQRANPDLEEVLRRAPGYPPALDMHADQFVHLLLDDATSVRPTRLSAPELADAWQRFTADLEAAIRNARTTEERQNLELQLAYLSGNWEGLGDRIDKVMDQTGCDFSSWVESIAGPFGHARQQAERWERMLPCHPLVVSVWAALMRAYAWSLDADHVLSVGRRALESMDHDNLVIAMAHGYVMRGELDRADEAATARLKSPDSRLGFQILLAAARGDAAGAAGMLEQYRQLPDRSGWTILAQYAWFGDRENANRLAAEFDHHPMGSVVLDVAADQCQCGAPWDLTVTPVFAKNLADAGLSWPPPTPIVFPLKDW